MKIIIVGCGKIGITIIESLVSEGHDVVAVDANKSAVEEVGNIYDVMCLCGNGVDCETLSEAGVEKAELFVAVTGSDEFNMLSCYIARRMGARHTVARIRNPEYNDKSLVFMRQTLDISMPLNPELFTAQEIYNTLKLQSAVNIETFSQRNLEMVELIINEDCRLDGFSLMELKKRYKAEYLICAVKRENEVFIPGGNFILRKGDKIGLVAAPNGISKIVKMLGFTDKRAKNIIILGASMTAFYLAKRLIAGGNSVKIIDKNEERCRIFAEALSDAVVICGDGAEQEVLLEEGLDKADAFVTLTGMDEENILISIFAVAHDVPKVITKVNRGELAEMAGKLGLTSIVSPKKIVSDIVIRYARALENSMGSNVETLYKLMDSEVEALEFHVSEDFEGRGIPLKDMKFKPNLLIAGIIRKRKPFIPTGDDVILAGDKVVVVASGQKFIDLSDILR
ncbi:MAG: Trk system potassium transporter TrkA [Clostridia bacterium]|nr:Trk system potassium transporter TrkA [Clostridia bacterium]